MNTLVAVALSLSLSQAGAHPQTDLKQGRSFFLKAKLNSAEQSYQRAMNLAATNSPVWVKAQFALAEVKIKQGDFKAATDLYMQALSALNSSDFRNKLAQTFFSKARTLYHPQPWQAWLKPEDEAADDDKMGDREEKLREAKVFYLVAARLAQQGQLAKKARWLKWRCMSALGENQAALTEIEQQLEHPETMPGPEHQAMLLLAAEMCIMIQRGRQAEAYLREFVSLYPDATGRADADILLAKLYQMPQPTSLTSLIQGQAALQHFSKNFSQDPRRDQAQWTLAKALAYRHQDEALQKVLKTILKQSSTSTLLAKAQFALAESLSRQQRYAQAIKTLQIFLRQFPEHQKASAASQTFAASPGNKLKPKKR